MQRQRPGHRILSFHHRGLLLLAAAVVLALCLGGAKHGGEKPQRTDAKGGTNEKNRSRRYARPYGDRRFADIYRQSGKDIRTES